MRMFPKTVVGTKCAARATAEWWDSYVNLDDTDVAK